jgi:3-hydroxybutyryl-CoA dehydrogenase
MLTVSEAAFLIYEGGAEASPVDEVLRDCFRHPSGPLEPADLIGIDTILYSLEVLDEHYGDTKYLPCPLSREMTDAGLPGRKTGAGCYPHESLGEERA